MVAVLPETPHTHVFTDVPGDPDDGGLARATTEEVVKKIRGRKKSVRTVEDRRDAELVVEVLDQASEKSTGQMFIQKREGTARTTDSKEGAATEVAAFGDIRERFVLLTRVYVPRGRPFEMRWRPIAGVRAMPRSPSRSGARCSCARTTGFCWKRTSVSECGVESLDPHR
ncbi:MAG TPA: hypothetical protein VLK65_05325 [Vicinamibacteria bacterium]|nr:hypothetical protein [Vicinamibacteria bacterium]